MLCQVVRESRGNPAHLLIFGFCTTSGVSQASDALLIGVSDYKESPLENPINDVQLLSRKLKGLGWNVTTLKNPNESTMKTGLNRFANNLKDKKVSTALIYFSGHGFQLAGENYLVPLGLSKDVRSRINHCQYQSTMR